MLSRLIHFEHIVIEFPRDRLDGLNGQTLQETFDALIWTAEDVCAAREAALAADPSFPVSGSELLTWIFGRYVPFSFDIEATVQKVTGPRKLPDTYQRQLNPASVLGSGHKQRRQKRYIRVKIAEGATLDAKPAAVQTAVTLILQHVAALFRYILDGRIELWARTPSGTKEKLERSDWRTRPDLIRLDFSNNRIRMPAANKTVVLFSNAALVLGEETRRSLNKPPRISDAEITDWLDETFFRYVKYQARPKVFTETKRRFPKMSEDRFDKIWDEFAPQDWKKSGTIPKKYRGIKILK